jgi:hypothetical protein
MYAAIAEWSEDPMSIQQKDDQPVFYGFPGDRNSALFITATEPPIDVECFKKCTKSVLDGMNTEAAFVILDESQNRRRNAAMHYHSTILLQKKVEKHFSIGYLQRIMMNWRESSKLQGWVDVIFGTNINCLKRQQPSP